METCSECGRHEELRLGYCFECASNGEARAARRTVAQHLGKAVEHLLGGQRTYAWYDVTWAWQRLTRTGDYRPGGYFDLVGHGWRR
jgi:hypothetical protein